MAQDKRKRVEVYEDSGGGLHLSLVGSGRYWSGFTAWLGGWIPDARALVAGETGDWERIEEHTGQAPGELIAWWEPDPEDLDAPGESQVQLHGWGAYKAGDAGQRYLGIADHPDPITGR